MDIESIQSCLQHLTDPKKPWAKAGVIPWCRNLLQPPSGCLVLAVIGRRHRTTWIPGKFSSGRMLRWGTGLCFDPKAVLFSNVNRKKYIWTQHKQVHPPANTTDFKDKPDQWVCSARVKICPLTHFQQQRNAAPCWGPSCHSKQCNVLLPPREINLKFWAGVITCFCWQPDILLQHNMSSAPQDNGAVGMSLEEATEMLWGLESLCSGDRLESWGFSPGEGSRRP